MQPRQPLYAPTPSRAAHLAAVAAGGLVGALLRWVQTGAFDSSLPFGTFVVNALGSLALGAALAALPHANAGRAHPLGGAFFAAGLCGAYTTFGAFVRQVAELAARGEALLALAHLTASLAAGLLGAHAGQALASRPPSRCARVARLAVLWAPAAALIAAAALHTAPAPTAGLALGAAAVALGGAAGAAARDALGQWVLARAAGRFPWGTLLVNLSGCSLLGLYVGVTQQAAAPRALDLLVVTGLLGGYTTFSMLSFETHALLAKGDAGRALGNAAGSVLAGLAAFLLGRGLAA